MFPVRPMASWAAPDSQDVSGSSDGILGITRLGFSTFNVDLSCNFQCGLVHANTCAIP